MTQIPLDPQATPSNQHLYTHKVMRNETSALESLLRRRVYASSDPNIWDQAICVKYFPAIYNADRHQSSSYGTYAVCVRWYGVHAVYNAIHSLSRLNLYKVLAKQVCVCEPTLFKLIDAATHTTSLLTFKPPRVFITPLSVVQLVRPCWVPILVQSDRISISTERGGVPQFPHVAL